MTLDSTCGDHVAPGLGAADLLLISEKDVVFLPTLQAVKRMGYAQRIASLALVALALIAMLAVLVRCASPNDSGPTSASSITMVGPSAHAKSPAGASGGASAGSASGASSSSDQGGDGLPTVDLSSLPPQAATTVKLIQQGGPFPYSRDGIVYNNSNHDLPQHPRGWYHEYTVKTPGASTRGTRRVITGQDGTMYYTGDHYNSFQRITQ